MVKPYRVLAKSGVLAMNQGYGVELSDKKLEIATEIQQLICQQVGILNRALETHESVQFQERNERIRELFGLLGCAWTRLT